MELVHRPPAPVTLAPKKRQSKKLLLITVVALILIVSGLVTGYLLWPRQQVVVPESVRSAINLSIVKPKKIPNGFNFDRQPFYEPEEKIVITVLKNESGSKITLSQQKKPENVDLKQIDAAETFLINIGTVYILKGEKGQLQSIIETGDSWLYVNADDDISVENYKAFINDLVT